MKRRFKSAPLILAALLLPTCCVLAFQTRVGESATAADSAVAGHIPKDATNVRWYLPGAFGPNTVYEFDASLEEFEQWVRQHKGPNLSGPVTGEISAISIGYDEYRLERKRLHYAVSYGWLEGDRSTSYVYDLDTGRAYYHHATR